MIEIAVVLLKGGHGSTAIGPIEVFGSTGLLWNLFSGTETAPPFKVITVTPDGKAVSPYDGAYSVTPSGSLKDIGKPDLIFIPSIGIDVDGALDRYRVLIPWIAAQYKAGVKIAGVCTGISLLAASGILDGKRGTTHWGMCADFNRRWPRVKWQPDLVVTEEEGVFCGAGVYAAIDLSLYLVEKLASRRLAVECAKALLVTMPRPTQSGFGVLPVGADHADRQIHEAEEWINSHAFEDINFEGLAKEMGMSSRHLIRRFKAATGAPPLGYLQKLRIATSKRLLEEDFRSIQDISRAVGYDDIAFFRTIFKRHTGMSPRDYRTRFGRAD